jgi:hypothetical protein
MSEYCKKMIWGDFREHRCRNNAKTDGFCGTHHPDAQARRDKKREDKYQKDKENSIYAKYSKLREAAQAVVDSQYCNDGYRNISVDEDDFNNLAAALGGDKT